MGPVEKSKIVRAWMAANQGKHKCACGCGEFVVIKIHHHVRGIPLCINGHYSRIENAMKGMCGPKNPHFKSGRYVGYSGYVFVLIPGPGRSRYKFEHRLVMEKHLGRKLKRKEVVHHKNGNKSDNRIENLELMTNAEHTSYHARRGEVGFSKHRNWKPRKGPRVPSRRAG